MKLHDKIGSYNTLGTIDSDCVAFLYMIISLHVSFDLGFQNLSKLCGKMISRNLKNEELA